MSRYLDPDRVSSLMTLSTIYWTISQMIKTSCQPANLLITGIWLYPLFLFRAEVYLGDCPHGLGLPDTKVVTHKSISGVGEVVGRMGSHWKEYRSEDGRSELGVAEDLTLGKSHLYKATPTLIM